MLITQLKSNDVIAKLAKGKTFIVTCEGCKEVHFPEVEAAEVQKGISKIGTVITDYICNPENLARQLAKYEVTLKDADTVLVFSCGVGVQTVAEKFKDKMVFAACDTYPLPGGQGVTPLEWDCDQCGQCYLNNTGAICPITACSKGLINGQCGGAKNGKCEVDSDMDCGWELIYRRLEKLQLLDALQHPVKFRDYTVNGTDPE